MPETQPAFANMPPAAKSRLSDRLVSLDVFRGMVILTMLVVNNIGDHSAVSSFFSHADWTPVSLRADLISWCHQTGDIGFHRFADFPLWWHCTLADLVMPLFMLIIGVSIPFSDASASRRKLSHARVVLTTVRRGATLYLLGWIIGISLQILDWKYSGDSLAKLKFSLGMDVLQLLGVSYIIARLLFYLPTVPRLLTAGGLLVWHWGFLRFYPQGDIIAGTFTQQHNAVAYAYAHWSIFRTFHLFPRVNFNIAGMLSVPPAAGTMLLGTFAGKSVTKPSGATITLLLAGIACVIVGIVWAFDLPMNKPRWTPCYLFYCSGIGMVLLACLHQSIDVARIDFWSGPFRMLGVNPIGIYFLSILAKIWLLNMPAVKTADGKSEFLTSAIIHQLQFWTSPSVGSWIFTVLFVGAVWILAGLAYRKHLIWKV